MTGTRDNDDRPSVTPSPSVKPKVSKAKTVEEIDGDLARIWVRQMLGRNRGEVRDWNYTRVDALLDERLAANG